MKITCYLAAAAIFSQASLAAVIQNTSSLNARDLVIPEWNVQVTPGGDNVILKGTVQEVHAQLLELNPNWDEDFPEPSMRPAKERSLIEKRTDFHTMERSCGYSYSNYGWQSDIEKGISYLRRLGGNPQLAPGRCSRVSCSWSSAIFWCNTSSEEKWLNSFGSIADGAQYIVDLCQKSTYMYGGRRIVGGETRHNSGWRVEVSADAC